MPNILKAKRVHVSLAVADLEKAIEDYTVRLGVEPATVAGGEYALFLTPILNLSITEVPGQAGTLRHLGFEDDNAAGHQAETDNSGFMWEHFTLAQQAEEINARYQGDWHPAPGQ
jgi:catechol 2,3-dioxygenase-like lactoylglutathione lyase family enzyme